MIILNHQILTRLWIKPVFFRELRAQHKLFRWHIDKSAPLLTVILWAGWNKQDKRLSLQGDKKKARFGQIQRRVLKNHGILVIQCRRDVEAAEAVIDQDFTDKNDLNSYTARQLFVLEMKIAELDTRTCQFFQIGNVSTQGRWVTYWKMRNKNIIIVIVATVTNFNFLSLS